MGADKAFVVLDGQTLLARALELARAVTAEVRIVPLVEDRDGRIMTRTDIGLARWHEGRWEEFTRRCDLRRRS